MIRKREVCRLLSQNGMRMLSSLLHSFQRKKSCLNKINTKKILVKKLELRSLMIIFYMPKRKAAHPV